MKHIISYLSIAILFIFAAGCAGTTPAPAGDNQTTNEDTKRSDVVETELNLPLEVSVNEVEALRQREDVVLIDVREDWEYDEGHIPGVQLIPLGDLPQRMSEIPADKTIVAVCRSGNRSGQATNFLRQQGYNNVHNMTGGMNAWEEAKLPVE